MKTFTWASSSVDESLLGMGMGGGGCGEGMSDSKSKALLSVDMEQCEEVKEATGEEGPWILLVADSEKWPSTLDEVGRDRDRSEASTGALRPLGPFLRATELYWHSRETSWHF